jgi:hypothetical protein
MIGNVLDVPLFLSDFTDHLIEKSSWLNDSIMDASINMFNLRYWFLSLIFFACPFGVFLLQDG